MLVPSHVYESNSEKRKAVSLSFLECLVMGPTSLSVFFVSKHKSSFVLLAQAVRYFITDLHHFANWKATVGKKKKNTPVRTLPN